MKCEKCENEYPSPYYFATPTICKSCFENMSSEEQAEYQTQLIEREFYDEFEVRVGFGRRFGAAILDLLILTYQRY